jgi:hypothetical protein
MTNYPMLACASAFFVCTAVGCGGAPETTEEAAPAAATPAAAAAPSVFGGTDENGERPRLVAPVRGEAELGYTQPVVKQGTIDGREYVISTIQVKNMAAGAIAGLQVDEFWYDSAGNPVTGDNYRHPRPLQPEEVVTITLETPRNPAMDRNQYNFTHANGDINATLQPSLEAE